MGGNNKLMPDVYKPLRKQFFRITLSIIQASSKSSILLIVTKTKNFTKKILKKLVHIKKTIIFEAEFKFTTQNQIHHFKNKTHE